MMPRIVRRVPVEPDRPFLEMVTMEKSRLPAMPVMKRWVLGGSMKSSEISVPGWLGSLVLRMFRGMFFSRTGNTVISCSTCAPE